MSSSLGYTVSICWPTRYVYDSLCYLFSILVALLRHYAKAISHSNDSQRHIQQPQYAGALTWYMAKRLFLLGTMELASLLVY